MGTKSKRDAEQRMDNVQRREFIRLMSELHPHEFMSQSNVDLSPQPGRVGMVIERCPGEMPQPDQAGVLRGLWHRLSRITLLEFKSPTQGFRPSDLIQLENNASLYFADHWDDVEGRDDITLVLVVPSVNQALQCEIDQLKCTWEDLERGYARIHGLAYATYVVITNEAAEAEDDDCLRFFSDLPVQEPETLDWLQDWFAHQEQHMPQLKGTKSFQEMRYKYLSSFTPEERLAGLAPEEILARFTPEEILARFTPDELRAYLESLENKPA